MVWVTGAVLLKADISGVVALTQAPPRATMAIQWM